MRPWLPLICIGALAWVPIHGGAGSLPQVRVALAEFGLFEKDDEFVDSAVVPFEEGEQYGFRIYLRGPGDSVELREEWEMPGVPRTWGEAPRGAVRTLTKEGHCAVVTRTVAREKLVEVKRTVDVGDPEGEYELRLFLQGTLVKTFRFGVSD